jgi:hypothetical protein
MNRRSIRIFLLVAMPFAFLLKDVLATVVVLSNEPGISHNAARRYSFALLPGPLFVESRVMLFNVAFGALVGAALYVCLRFARAWLLIVPPAAFLLKDIIALTIAVLFTEAEITPAAALYSYIAMLPGSIFDRSVDPMILNVLFGALLGLIFYVYSKRRRVALG